MGTGAAQPVWSGHSCPLTFTLPASCSAPTTIVRFTFPAHRRKKDAEREGVTRLRVTLFAWGRPSGENAMPTETPYLEKALSALLLTAMRQLGQKEQVTILSRAGFGQTEIARLLGSTPKAISVRLAEIRRARHSAAKSQYRS